MDTSVSVVVPAHNHGDLLASAVNSVRAQRWPCLEIIIVNDGSTDCTADVARALQANDLRVYSEDNLGPAEARNIGIRDARYAWIAFLDADDEWQGGKLSAQFERLARSPSAAFSYGDAWVVAADGSRSLFRAAAPPEALKTELLFGNQLATPTVLVRRDRLFEAGLFNRTLPTGEDWDLWLRLAWRFEGAPVAVPLASVRRTQRHRPDVATLERSTFRVLESFFSQLASAPLARDPRITEEAVLAWHRAVLAKSALSAGDLPRSMRLLFTGFGRQPGLFLRCLSGRRPRVVAEPSAGS